MEKLETLRITPARERQPLASGRNYFRQKKNKWISFRLHLLHFIVITLLLLTVLLSSF